MLPWRRLDALSFDRTIEIHHVPGGAISSATVAGPFRTRRSGDLLVLRFDDSGEFAVALSPQALAWNWPVPADDARRMMLYSAMGGRSARSELRRIVTPQRRDALFKADLREASR